MVKSYEKLTELPASTPMEKRFVAPNAISNSDEANEPKDSGDDGDEVPAESEIGKDMARASKTTTAKY